MLVAISCAGQCARGWPRRALMVGLLCALAACGGGAGKRPPSATTLAAANAVAIHAIGLVGTPYRYGGNTPAGGFDCSGLVGFVFRESAGVVLPRSTAGIADLRLDPVNPARLRAGDLLLFGQGGRVDHIGIYVGERRFVHAPSTGGTVRLDNLDSRYWQQRWIATRRPLR